MKKLPLHPIINQQDSPHYDADEIPGIVQLEAKHSVDRMIGFCEISIDKYNIRMPHKNQSESDKRKIKTYEAYLLVLCDIIKTNPDFKNFSVENAMKITGRKYRYE